MTRHGEATITELSRGLHLTTVTIRHHVDALAREGLVVHATLRRKPGPGRPEVIYRPTARAADSMPRNYGELGGTMIAELSSSWPSDKLEDLLGSAARRVAATLLPSKGRTARERLTHVACALESRGYVPSIESAQAGPLILFANCPYREIAGKAPAMCCFDVALLETALESDVRLISRITSGDSHCRLLVTEKAQD